MKKMRLKIWLLTVVMLLGAGSVWGQVNISAGNTVTQNFTIGTTTTATLPTGWKMDKNTTARLVGSYSSAVSATERIGGNSLSSSAGNGLYNFGAGAEASATDRALGGLSSSSASKSVNVYVQLTNNGASEITSLTISYDVEKYRNGSNAAGFSIQMYYSTNGTTWTSAGSDFLTSFSADADNNGYASAPGATVNVTNKSLAQALAASSSIYLAWNYSVTTGTTTSNAQALGIDNVSITANGSEPSPDPTITVSASALTGFTYVQGSGPSTPQTFTISGSNLTSDISLATSTNYEISKTSGSGYTSPLTFAHSGGTVSETTVYVRLKAGLSAGSYNSEVLTATATGADNKTVTVSGSVTAPPDPEPTNHATNFAATANSASQITVTWTDATGAQLPLGYLVKASTGTPTAPVDGTDETPGTLIKKVNQGTQTAVFTGLNAETEYNFSIWPYTNSGSNIDYKTDGSVPTASAETLVLPWAEDFETGTKTGYATGNVTSTKGEWTLTEALLGTSADDRKNGTKSVRMRYSNATTYGIVSMNFDKTNGAGVVSVYHAKYGTNANGSWKLQMSINTGESWFDVGTTVNTTSTTLTLQNFDINQSGDVRFRIVQLSGDRINIDDFTITDYQAPSSSTWTGSSSTNWNLANNWNNGTPGPSTNVIITDVTNQPVIISSLTCNNLTLHPNSTLTINADKSLTVTGDLTLQSSAAGTATIVDEGTLTVTSGTTTVQQYLTTKSGGATTDNWWYLSSPVSGATSASILVDGSNNKFGYYEETNASYPQITATNTTLDPGKGYLAQINTTGTYEFTGTLNTGNVGPITLTRTPAAGGPRGFNLVGNPYPSHIHWNSITGFGTQSARTDIRPTIWVRTRTATGTMDFDTFDGEIAVTKGKSGAMNGYIAPMQAFWVKVHVDNTSPTITFTNALRSAQNQNSADNRLRAPQQSNRQILRLEVSNGLNFDQMVISTNTAAQNGYDFYDSDKISASNTAIPELYSLVAGRELVIDKRTAIEPGASAIVGFRPGQAGSFSIKATELTNLENVKVILKDNHLNTETELLANESYTFTSDATATTNRFSIEFRAPGATTSLHEVNAKNTLVYVNEANQIEVQSVALSTADRISVFNLAGQQLVSQAASGQVTVINEPFGAGVYLVKVNSHLQKVIVK